jgi:integrase
MAGGIRRVCRCRDDNGKDLGAKCPKLKQRNHGTLQIRQELAQARDGSRQPFRRGGYTSRTEAEKDLDRVRDLLKLADGDENDALAISEMLLALDHREKLPEPEQVKVCLRSRQPLNDKGTVQEWMEEWEGQLEQRKRQGSLSKATLVSYKSHIRLYINPNIGGVRRDRLAYADLVEMFNTIADDNDVIAAANEDRRAVLAEIKATKAQDARRRLREQLESMPPFRRPVYLSSQQRILATLRKALNDAIGQQKPTSNPARNYRIEATPPKPIVWTGKRVEEWHRTGRRPGPVMVWMPEHAGSFLDCVAEHDPEFEAMWHLMVFRGPRRGETAGLSWADTDLDSSSLDITTQLTEIEYEVEEAAPKSVAGVRTIALDADSVTLLRRHWLMQQDRRRTLGLAWVESGKVFTREDGSALRPSWINDRFSKLVATAGLPPIRLHDLRHTAATLMLLARIDMKVIQETLGHSRYTTTMDLYTSVVPELAKDAAEAVVTVVPRQISARAPMIASGAPILRDGAPTLVGDGAPSSQTGTAATVLRAPITPAGHPSGTHARSTPATRSEGAA